MARTPEERKTLTLMAIDHIAEGGFLTAFSKQHDIPYATLVRWIDSEAATSDMYSRARIQGYMKRMEDMEDDAERLMEEVRTGQIPDPGPTIAAFKELRTVRQWNAGKFAKGLFGDSAKVEHSGKIETAKPARDLSGLSDDELAALEAIEAKVARAGTGQ